MQNKKIIPLMMFVGVCLAAGITLIWLLTDPVEAQAHPLIGQPIVRGEVIIEETVVLEQEAPLISEDDLFARVIQAEAGSETLIGKIAVAAVVLNRAERDNETIYEVLTKPSQFATPSLKAEEECYTAIEFARAHRDIFPDDMVYFRNKHYHTKYGYPYVQIGGHYFSTEEEHK